MPPKCLIADDSLYARMVVKDVVRRIYPAAEFHEASSGEQTLSVAEGTGYEFDWYLLDVNMTPPDGVETSKMLMERGVPANKIALVTGNRSFNLMDEANLLGVQYINKAISPEDVDPFMERLRAFFSRG
ncbi:response regulator transcription factor [Oceanobacter kriegii]|uniref:response regulator transcription factor n=1 Tax=Oceanobacter kriegii TaxID=64972 RepID=UPI00055E1C0C|nr:response regulator [Oceanobacter kriegii]